MSEGLMADDTCLDNVYQLTEVIFEQQRFHLHRGVEN